jgi:hypothetical protein
MLDENGFADILRSPSKVAEHFSNDDVESTLRSGIMLQWMLSKPEDRNAEQLQVSIEAICRKLVPEVANELQNLAEGGG